MKDLLINLPNILLAVVLVLVFAYPIGFTIYMEYNPTPLSVILESEQTEENKIKDHEDKLITMLYYQTIHMSKCNQCNGFNFPACEESRGVVDAILEHNTIDQNATLLNLGG